MTDQPTAALLLIGNELLSGRTQDLNLNYIAKGLNEVGVRFMESRVVPDIEAMIVEAVNALRSRYSYVFTTGGIGPTHDDITAACIAKAFDVPLTEHPEAIERLEAFYAHRKEELNEARRRMANTPEGASLVDNPVSGAPGFVMENVYVFAGIPNIMQAMFDSVKLTLVGGKRVLSHTVTTDLVEGVIAKDLGAIQQDYPETEIGSYPFVRRTKEGGLIGVSIVVRSADEMLLNQATQKVKAMVSDHQGNFLSEM